MTELAENDFADSSICKQQTRASSTVQAMAILLKMTLLCPMETGLRPVQLNSGGKLRFGRPPEAPNSRVGLLSLFRSI